MKCTEIKIIFGVAIFCMVAAIDKMAPLSEAKIERVPPDGVNDIEDFSGHRSQRAIVSVIMKLLSSAQKGTKYGRGGTEYVKSGGYGQAKRDFFDLLKPIKVKTLDYPYGGFEGKVGDSVVSVYKKSIRNDKPTIAIWKRDGRSPDLIRYED